MYSFVFRIQYIHRKKKKLTENGNFRLFCKQKRKTELVFPGRQTKNGISRTAVSANGTSIHISKQKIKAQLTE